MNTGKGRRLPGAKQAGFKSPPRPARKNGRPPPIFLALCLVWAAGASWFAFSGRQEIQRLTDEAEIRRVAQEDKVRALTRRLVGVASHQVLEEEGLSGRLADIITRQVDLETRQAALAAMAERALGDRVTGAVTPSPSPIDRGTEAAPAVRTRRGTDGKDTGGAVSGTPVPRPGRGTSLEPPSVLPSGGGAAAILATRDQFARIEASLGRVEDGQRRVVTSLAASAQAVVERIRGLLADLRISITPLPASASAAPDPRDTFAVAVAQAETAFTEAAQWQSVTNVLPLRAPIEGESGLSSNFGMRSDPFTGTARMHAGMDFRSAVGTPVHAAANGRVVTAGQSGGYGNLVEIDHGHDIVTRYGHLSAINVAVDQSVAAGMVIGLVGSTGRSTGPHLHYETRLSAAPVDPARFLSAGRKLFAVPVAEASTELQPEIPADAAD